jgi:hypothetical protein
MDERQFDRLTKRRLLHALGVLPRLPSRRRVLAHLRRDGRLHPVREAPERDGVRGSGGGVVRLAAVEASVAPCALPVLKGIPT